MPREPRPDRAGLWIFLTLVGLYSVTFGGHFYSGDGIEMARTAESLVLRGDLALVRGEGERDWGYPGRGGRRYAPYPLGQSLVEAPLIGLASAALGPLPLDAHLEARLRHAAAVSSNVFLTAGIGWVLFLLAGRLGYPRRVAAGVALLAGIGTMLWVYARQDFGDPLSALMLLSAVHLMRRGRDTGRQSDLGLAGACLGYALFTKYQMVIYAPVLWGYLVFLRVERRQRGWSGLLRETGWLAAPVILFGLADLGVNYWKFGAFLSTGYEQEASPWAGLAHIPAGLHGFLFSPGKSIFLYNPVLILWPAAARLFHRDRPSESRLVLLAAGVTLLFFSPLYWWHGDWSWGPRYLLPILPLACLAMAPLLRSLPGRPAIRRALIVLLIAAVLVNVLGMAVNFFFHIRALTGAGHVHDDWNFIPGLSPLAFHAHLLRSNLSEWAGGPPIDYVYSAWRDGRFTRTVIPMGEYSREGKTPDFFFFKPYDTRLEQWSLGGAGLLAIVATGLCARKLRRELRGAGRPG